MILFLCFPWATSAENMPAQPPAQMLSKNTATPQPSEDWLPLRPQKQRDDLHDHLAKVFEIQGEVRILKQGTNSWVPLQKDSILEAGDQVLTGEKSRVRITYDDQFLNLAVIREKTKVEFQSIEPTDIHLEDGSIFSVVDKLDGSAYQISTPTAVAAVRGTHFETGYKAETGVFNLNLFPDGGDMSHVMVTDIEQGRAGATVELAEGEKLATENDTESLKQESVEVMSAEEVSQYKQELGAIFKDSGVDEDSRLEALDEATAPGAEPSEPAFNESQESTMEEGTNMDYEVDQAPEVEEDIAVPADEGIIPEFEVSESETQAADETASLRDHITSGQAAQNEEATTNQDQSGGGSSTG